MSKKIPKSINLRKKVLRRAADRLDELRFKYDSQFDDMTEEMELIRWVIVELLIEETVNERA